MVIGRVPGGNEWCAVLFRDTGKKPIPHQACCLLERSASLHPRAHIRTIDNRRHCVALSNLLSELRVLLAVRSQLMVKVSQDQGIPARMQTVKETKAVRPAGHTDDDSRIFRKQAMAVDKLLHSCADIHLAVIIALGCAPACGT